MTMKYVGTAIDDVGVVIRITPKTKFNATVNSLVDKSLKLMIFFLIS